ncbi:UDP-N-acetylmuramoyl-L-alanine--D-glutamate ligase [[Clostridium] polysaccharolyticum]|uniref:UDP-N-acetylmuramoylalanine--D-glutamate ligase n=1 Tax=[Clostridium] polysaccharolyticum TaxID=29364 RepID=A0A1H9Y2A3_9FIRM|nr:UDP-N-acetylmuramoyl-L-alanine--D-glutamate ligase [[Clostridium] polysaccharolyticum]SES62433.1 UDP-N-acetylmuramoylalanine--D-glutamate ligase [[Clostridium] polysaccharolyticum]
MNLAGKNVLVIGTGKSGVAASGLLVSQGADVILFDGNKELDKEAIQSKTDKKVQIVLGALTKEQEENVELLVLSPGVPIDIPMVESFQKKNIPIWGEIELAYQFAKGRIAAITGTNGKTTTTSLAGEIMKAYYESVFVVGNIGNPYTDVALETREDTVVVAEISSFQLETIDQFHPAVSAILNITPDHLNRHHTMECYIDTKFNITKNQTEKEYCVLNYEDEVLRQRAESLGVNVIYFSSQRILEKGIYLDENQDIIWKEDSLIKVCNVHDLKLLGTHNYENVMAAVAIAVKIGVPMDVIRKAVCDFVAVEHRIEFVAEKNGVAFYNDSKGTNPDAAIKGIQAMVRPTLLIGGGYDKGGDFTEWIEAFDGKVKLLVLIGQTREKIAETAKKCGFDKIVFAESLEEAVNVCWQNAESGDAILLSPACASWGMFPNYEVRGEMFKELAKGI